MMKTRRLVTVKPHKYGTRHLTAGEEYEAPVRHALALVAGRKARFAADASAPPPLRPPPVHPPEPAAAASEIGQLRLQATGLGIEVDGRWGVGRLRYEISKKEPAP